MMSVLFVTSNMSTESSMKEGMKEDREEGINE